MISFLRGLVWLLSAVALLLFCWVSGARLLFPLPLHPAEGAMMEQVARFASDQAAYVEPSLQYVPLPIMPGFMVIASVFTRNFGPGLWQIRLIEILASLLIVGMIIRVLRLETQSWSLAVGGAGLFLMASGSVTGTYDLGRPELFALAFVLAAFYQLRSTSGRMGAVWAALMLAGAFFVQLEMAWFALAACFHLLVNDRRRLIVFVLALLAPCIAGYVALAAHWQPWFDFYTWDLPAHGMRLEFGRLATDLRDLLLRGFAPLTVASLLTFAMPKRPWIGGDGAWMWFVTGGLAYGFTAVSEPWSGEHAWLPLVLGLCIFGSIAIARLVQHLATWPGSSRLAGRGIMLALLSLQLCGLLHGTEDLLPPAGIQPEWVRYQAWVRSQRTSVLAPGYSYVTSLVGAEPAYNTFALDQLVRARDNRLLAKDPDFVLHMIEPLRSGTARPMLLTEKPLEESGPFLQGLAATYELVRTPPELTYWRAESEGPRLPTYLYQPIEGFRAEAPVSPAPEQPAPVEPPAATAGNSDPNS